MRDYLYGLKEPLNIEDLKPLIGQEFTVRQMGRSWGKDVVDVDKMVITKIDASVDVESGKTRGLSSIHIYSDYWLEGRNKYNAWCGLKAFQKAVKTADTVA